MLTDAEVQAHADRIRGDGFTVIEAAASAELVEGLITALQRIEREGGREIIPGGGHGWLTIPCREEAIATKRHKDGSATKDTKGLRFSFLRVL